ncbi:separase isoform X3 [Setaria viridis]|uniref:separase isoform X3 n=1 Tax=Setaria viridis TaxID=4556 RepID=UPI003B3B90E2
MAMEAAAADLLAALSSPSSHAGLHSRFAAYLQPFTPYLPTANPNPKPPPRRATKQTKQPPPPPDAATLRSLAKRFLPFIARALQLLPPLVRASPGSGDAGGGGPDELLETYGLLLDCLEAISPCLAGKPYSVLLQRGRFVCFLESRGHLGRANAEAAAALDALCSSLSPPTTSTKSRRGAASVAPALLPDPGSAGDAGRDPEVTTLAVELTVCLANCASKDKVKEAAPYERVLSLVQQLQPWLLILADDVRRKYLILLVNALTRCTFFLVAESSTFRTDLVHRFCGSMIEECVKAQMIERLPAIARKICSSVDLSWGGSTELLLHVLKEVTDSVVRVKADLPKAVDELMLFVAYFTRCILSGNRDLCLGTSELLYKQGDYFSEVSSSTASVLLLYATGLYFSTQQGESEVHPSLSVDILNNQKYLQALDKAMVTTAPRSNDKTSSMAYLDALEFVCKVLLQQVNAVWKSFSDGEAIHYSGNMDYVLTALHQFIDSSFAAYSCTKMSEGDNERLHEQRRTLLRVLVLVIKVSFITNKDVQKSLDSINRAISSKWLMLEELKFLISSLGNIGVTLHNTGHFKEALKALELCCQTIWAYVELSYCRLSSRTEGNGIIEDLPKDTLNNIVLDGFARIEKMVNTLHRCGSKNTREIVVKSLSKLLAYGTVSEYFNSSLILIKLWVKTTCKDFENNKGVDSAPLLYHSLLGCPSPLPKELIGLIVEQESLAYGLMEARGSVFSAEMQMRVINILLDEIYCSKECFRERSRVLVRKAGALRARGVQNISSCLDTLSEAISLLDLSRGDAIVTNQLAIAHCLYAHCAQEGNLGGEVIFENARRALSLWSRVESFHHSDPGMVLQQPSRTIVPLLCSLVDLLSMKGCFELQFKLCEVMIMIWKQENLPLEKLMSLLFTNGRLSHACCHLPLDEQFIYIAEHLGVDCHQTEFWRKCFEGDHPSFFMFLQRMLHSDLFIPQSCEHSFGRQFSFDAGVDEVREVALSLVSEDTSNDQSTFLAGYLYYDLSERLLSCGLLFQAFSHGKEALDLRKKLLKRKFKLNSGVSANTKSQHCGQELISLEAWGPAIAEIWPDCSRSTSARDSFLTPWNVLRCYLESTLQVAMMHELIGNGTEAEILLRTGKEISDFHGLSVFCIAFTSLLGQLYRKRYLCDEADSELKYARDLLVENDAIISCKPCKLTLEISVDMQDGDLSWSLFEKDCQEQSGKKELSSALGKYQSAINKWNSTDLKFCTGSSDSCKTGCPVCNKDCIIPIKHEACNQGKEFLTSKDGVLPPCSVCVLLRQASVHHCNESTKLKALRKNLRNAEASPPLDVKAKRTSRNSSRLAKEHIVETHAKTIIRSSKRNAHLKGAKASTELNSKNGTSWSDELPKDALVCGEAFPDGIDHSKDDLCNMFGCWKCLLVKSLKSGCIRNILQFRLDCVRRRQLVPLLLKKARALGSHRGGYVDHEVHSIYWRCISLLYFRSLPQDCYRTYEPHLVGLIVDGSTGDFLPFERAEILRSMSFFLLKGSLSEQSRDVCCSLFNVKLSDVVPWLLKAFVLSRESPSLFQEVCKLIACIFLLSTRDSSIQWPLCSQGSLTLNHWAAYFHQISVGTYLNCHYLANLQAFPREKVQKSTLADFRSGMDGDVSKSLRYPSMDIEYIEKHITEFFQKLPDVPVVCVSMLGGDYANVIAKFVLDPSYFPSYFPAWMLLSRFDSTGEPTTMLLPVDAISGGSQSEDSSIKDLGNPIGVLDKKWQCPWGYAITDYVAPTFKKILEENFVSLSSATLTINDVHADHVRWWSHRMKLNNCLDNMLKDMEESWFGPWKCLLLGHQLSDQHMEAALSEVDFKANPTLIKAILGGAVSVDEVQECVYQLVLYKGYFGRGGCCGKDRLRGFSCQIEDEALEALTCTIKNAANELPKPVDRDPIILVLDINVQMLPWENLPVLRNQEIYRMPSMTSIFLALSRSNNLLKDGSVMAPPFPVIDPFNTFYLLNPSGDLSSTQEEFDQLFRNYDWKGKAGDPPPEAGELAVALTNHDLFLYFGHGSGTQYVSGKEIEKLNNCAAALLMGCSSGTLHCKGSYAPRGAPLSYLSAGSPAIIANLWDVSDKDIDRFSKALLDSWLQQNFADGNICSNCCQLTQEFEAMKIASKENGRTRRKGTRGKRPQQINNSTKSCSCRQRRIASYLSEARRACRLQLLIGASPVCYGVPTIIRKKVTTDSATGDER